MQEAKTGIIVLKNLAVDFIPLPFVMLMNLDIIAAPYWLRYTST